MKQKRTYYAPGTSIWHDRKTDKYVTVPIGYPSDGASGPAIDIYSWAWWFHDVLCDRGTWDDGSAATPKDASRVLKDILKQEGRDIRAPLWGFWTWIYTSMPWSGYGKAGMKEAHPEKAGAVEIGMR